MNKIAHRLYISSFVIIVLFSLFSLLFKGYDYYNVSLEDRYFHPENSILKPSGEIGHGLGILGSFFMLVGVGSYMIRKRYKKISRWGYLKHWLEFHIFLCTLGPILVLFHTTFKFGGIVAISFWSMVAVFMSGVIGRFIYIQIPRSIEGQELTLHEVKEMSTHLEETIRSEYKISDRLLAKIDSIIKGEGSEKKRTLFLAIILAYIIDFKRLRQIKSVLRNEIKNRVVRKEIARLIRKNIVLQRRIERLTRMQNLFKYWHVIHLPFAIVMLVIMIIHVGVTLTFGYRWIF